MPTNRGHGYTGTLTCARTSSLRDLPTWPRTVGDGRRRAPAGAACSSGHHAVLAKPAIPSRTTVPASRSSTPRTTIAPTLLSYRPCTSAQAASHSPTRKTNATPTGPIALVTGPYGFLVPKDWTLIPLTNFGGPASFANFSNPNAPKEAIAFEGNGGSEGIIYLGDRSINSAGMPELLTGSDLSASRQLSPNELTYTCRTPPEGMETRGVVVVRPFPEGFVRVEATLPRDQDKAVSEILDSVSSDAGISTAPPNAKVADAQCTPGQLSAAFGFVDNASYALGGVIFTNQAASPCTLTGRPSVHVLDSHGNDLSLRQGSGAGNTLGPPPTQPIVLSAHGLQPQAGVPVDWHNWCGSPPGAVSVKVQFPGWTTALTTSPSANGRPTTTPPCVDKSITSRLDVDVVRFHDANGYR